MDLLRPRFATQSINCCKTGRSHEAKFLNGEDQTLRWSCSSLSTALANRGRRRSIKFSAQAQACGLSLC